MGYKYKAFISYSHKDRKWASWLHRRLENYTFPKSAGGVSANSAPLPKNLKPIFRDREELAAADNLGDKIEQALSASENLIIICSPDAAASHWVNQEILYFKRHNRGAKIFSVIVDGEPFADGKDGAVECLPEALRFQLKKDGTLSKRPAEPLAADLRPQGDGKRLGTLKLISGIAGLGLDDLVQRDLTRARRRVTAITAGALATVLAMGTMTTIAIRSRDEAQHQRAEAEGLVEYMVTELREEIRGSIGELAVTTAINNRLLEYYKNGGDLTSLPGDSLELRALIIGADGEDAENSGDFETASKKYLEFNQIMTELLLVEPDNSNRLFTLAKSENRLGLFSNTIGKHVDALPHLRKAETLLDNIPPGDRRKGDWARLAAYVQANICVALLKSEQSPVEALQASQASIDLNKQLIVERPEDFNAQYDLVFHYLWLSESWAAVGNEIEAESAGNAYIKLSDELVLKDERNLFWLDQQMQVYTHYAEQLNDKGKAIEATPYLQKALNISKRLISTDDKNENWLKYHRRLTQTLGKEI